MVERTFLRPGSPRGRTPVNTVLGHSVLAIHSPRLTLEKR